MIKMPLVLSAKFWIAFLGTAVIMVSFQNCSGEMKASKLNSSTSDDSDNSGQRDLDPTDTDPTDIDPGDVGGGGKNPLDFTKEITYATGALLDSTVPGDVNTTILTDATDISSRFRFQGAGDFFYSTNEFGTWTNQNQQDLRLTPSWNLSSQMASTPPYLALTYDFGSRQARVDVELAIGNGNFLTDFAADFFYGPLAYPELGYGVKDTVIGRNFRIEAPNIDQQALPAPVGALPDFVIDYEMTSTETQNATNLFNFGGQNHYQERNIAMESFFHSDCSTNNVNRDTEVYEIMLWLDIGPERGPGGRGAYGGDVTIDGRQYEVWSKNRNGPGYIAFVDKDPATSRSGTINWTVFVDWVRLYGHQVKELFNKPDLFNQPPLSDNYCMSNILIGNEIWWGSGSFEISKWDIKAHEKL